MSHSNANGTIASGRAGRSTVNRPPLKTEKGMILVLKQVSSGIMAFSIIFNYQCTVLCTTLV